MYNFIDSAIRENRHWTHLNVSDVPLEDLYRKYDEVLFRLNDQINNKTVELKLSNVSSMVATNSLNMVDWLEQISGTALPTTDELSTKENVKRVRFGEAFSVGLHVELSNISRHPDDEMTTSERSDIRIFDPSGGLDVDFLLENCLFTLDGIIHPVYKAHNSLYMLDGKLKSELTNSWKVGIINFEELGGYESMPITREDIHYSGQSVDDPIESVLINTQKDLTEYTPALVFMGKFYIFNTIMQQMGNGVIRINFMNMELVEKVLSVSKLFDLETMGLVNRQDQVMNVDKLLNEPEAILSLLFHESTKLMFIPKRNLSIHTRPLSNTNVPNVFKTGKYIEGFLMSSDGRVVNYTANNNELPQVLLTDAKPKPRYMYQTGDYTTAKIVTDQVYGYRPWMPDDLYEIHIYHIDV